MVDPINLSIGQPDFDVPEEVKAEAIAAIERGANRYTVTQGIAALQEKVRAKLRAEKGLEAENVLITSGVSGALVLAFLVLIDPGDEVLIPDPYFVMYKHLVNLAGGVPKFIDTYPDFSVTRERIEAAAGPRTKMVLVNSPANPTGAVASEAELRDIAAFAEQRDLIVISDEIYGSFAYDGPIPSIAKFYDKTLYVDGFSKTYAMTGWRLGFAVGPAEILSEMTKLQQFSFVCAPSFAQEAGVVALDVPTADYVEAYRQKRDLLYEGLRDKFEVAKPGGAFYMFPKAPWGTDQEFVEEAIRNNLLIIPGSVFSEKSTHFRIAYAATNETIERGIETLNRIADAGPPKS